MALGLLIAAGLLLGLALFFLLRSWRTRRTAGRAAYGFAQVENLKAVRVDLLRSGMVVVVALLVALAGLLLRPGDEASALDTVPTATATTQPAGELATMTPAPIFTTVPTQPPPSATPTSPLATLTPSPTPTQTLTPSATPLPTAIVASPNGLYLRDAPGGSAELELIPDGATLTLLGETAEADGLAWVRVRTALGNSGWVAADFVVLQSP